MKLTPNYRRRHKRKLMRFLEGGNLLLVTRGHTGMVALMDLQFAATWWVSDDYLRVTTMNPDIAYPE